MEDIRNDEGGWTATDDDSVDILGYASGHLTGKLLDMIWGVSNGVSVP